MAIIVDSQGEKWKTTKARNVKPFSTITIDGIEGIAWSVDTSGKKTHIAFTSDRNSRVRNLTLRPGYLVSVML